VRTSVVGLRILAETDLCFVVTMTGLKEKCSCFAVLTEICTPMFSLDAPDIQTVGRLLAVPTDIVVTSHRNPDGDAIGSSLALQRFLRLMGHTVHVAFPSDYPYQLEWMPGIKECLIFDNEPEATTAHIQRAQLIFLLDFNDLSRIDKMGEVVAQTKAKRVMIDHHLYPEPCADVVFSDSTASSTAEMVFNFLMALGNPRFVDQEVVEHVFVGIVTDTGSFRFNTTPKLFRTVAGLIELGCRDVLIQNLIQNSMSVKQLKLIGHCITRRMELIEEHHTGIIWLSKRDYEEFDIQRGDTEGIVNYLMMLRDVRMAVLVMEQPNIVKLSFRSKGDISVQEICRTHFKGGGHKNASGGFTFASLRQTLDKLRALLPEYKAMLDAG